MITFKKKYKFPHWNGSNPDWQIIQDRGRDFFVYYKGTYMGRSSNLNVAKRRPNEDRDMWLARDAAVY